MKIYTEQLGEGQAYIRTWFWHSIMSFVMEKFQQACDGVLFAMVPYTHFFFFAIPGPYHFLSGNGPPCNMVVHYSCVSVEKAPILCVIIRKTKRFF